MDIEVEYIDANGDVHNVIHKMTRLAFIKHFGIAGQGYAPKPQKLMRTLGMLLHYSNYIQRTDFYNHRFSRPHISLYDPTEINHFSNLAGKAIADFLSKRIGNSQLTINYEAAMRLRGMTIGGSRPDLLAFSNNWVFAVEAKGFTNGPGNMAEHKRQSQMGGIPVNYTIASVAHNLYRRVRCNYHDPINENISYDFELLNGISKKYYSGFIGFLNEKNFNVSELTIGNEAYYEIRLKYNQLDKLFGNSYIKFHRFDEFDFPSLLLTKKIESYANDGISNFNRSNNIIQENSSENRYLYIDNDGVGLKIR
jgi:hypothetical protein